MQTEAQANTAVQALESDREARTEEIADLKFALATAESELESQRLSEEEAQRDGKKLRKENLRLQDRSNELTTINRRTAQLSSRHKARTPPSPLSGAAAAAAEKKHLKRTDTQEMMILYNAIGEGCDPAVLARTLDSLDVIGLLMDTAPFWTHRIAHGQAIIASLNERWSPQLTLRMKQDYLKS